MVDERLLEDLPVAYAQFFRLRDQGLTLEEISRRLGLPEEALAVFVELAYEKLARVRAGTSILPPEEPDPD